MKTKHPLETNDYIRVNKEIWVSKMENLPHIHVVSGKIMVADLALSKDEACVLATALWDAASGGTAKLCEVK